MHLIQADRLDLVRIASTAEGLVTVDAHVTHGIHGLGQIFTGIELAGVFRQEAANRAGGGQTQIGIDVHLAYAVLDAFDNETESKIARGGYVLKNCEGEPDLILIATGSEVSLAMQAAEQLTSRGHRIRVVSMPCTSVFDQQDAEYKQAVLPLEVGARIAIEAGHGDFWYKYVGLDGRVIGINTFGESAPAPVLFEEFGFTVDNILLAADELLED